MVIRNIMFTQVINSFKLHIRSQFRYQRVTYPGRTHLHLTRCPSDNRHRRLVSQ